MAQYTGILGTSKSQLGIFVLGSGVASGPSSNNQYITDSISVASVTEITNVNLQSVNDSITVAMTVANPIDDNRPIADSSTVTDTITFVVSGTVAVTQYATEIFYTVSNDARATQLAVEIFYVTGAKNLADSVSISQTISVNRDRVITIADSVSVTPALESRTTDVLLTVSDLVVADDTVFGRNNNVRIAVTTSISISVPSIEQGQQILEDNGTVTDYFDYTTNAVHITIIDTVTTPNIYPNPVNFTITPYRGYIASVATVTDTISGGPAARQITVEDAFTPTDTITIQSPLVITVSDTVTTAPAITGGSSDRAITFYDVSIVYDSIINNYTINNQALQDSILTSTTVGFTTLSLFTELLVADTITVQDANYLYGQHYISVSDAVATQPLLNYSIPYTNEFLTDSVNVLDNTHFTPIRIVVVDNVTVKDRGATLQFYFQDTITVNDILIRLYDTYEVDTPSLSDSVNGVRILYRDLLDDLSFSDNTQRQITWFRSVTDTLIIPDTSFQRTVLDGIVVNVPVVVGALMTNYITLTTSISTITLPPPLLGDELDNVASTTVQRSMNGGTIIFIKSSARQRLKYTFRLDTIKAFELKAFLETNSSQPVTLTTWIGAQWIVYITSNPFEIQNAGRALTSQQFGEYSTIELELEGTKISG